MTDPGFFHFLLVDDDKNFLLLLKHTLIMGCGVPEQRIYSFDDLGKAAEFIKNDSVPERDKVVVFTMIRMDGMDVWKVIDYCVKSRKDLIGEKYFIHLTTSSINPADMMNTQENPHVEFYVHKPLSREDIKFICSTIAKKVDYEMVPLEFN